ncbi:MAG TPA: hypothetical protein VHD82_24670 [Amycolatopsis sp.]|nr:hypothetical protein [Amycolatopsis sp.]HVV12452.1 hypothetical protein [Amycolatopsis sp.]
MDAVLLAVPVRGEHVLAGEPGFRFNEGLVPALVMDASVGDDAHVVRVLQQVIDPGQSERLARYAATGSIGEPLGLSGESQVGAGPFAAGVLLKAPPDDLGTLGIEFDPGVVSPVAHLAAVEIAERSTEGRTAFFRLADEALHDLLGKVAGIELGELGKQPVEQSATGCVVDVLCAGHELHAVFLQRQVDRDVVSPVAGQAVDLVDDDVIRRDFLDVTQHPLQVVAVG